MRDVLIIGGGAIGSSVAVFLKRLAPDASVTVIESDLSHARSASGTAGSGGSRRLFYCPENIQMSEYSIDFVRHFDEHAAVNGQAPDAAWQQNGYLFVAPPGAGVELLESNLRIQRQHGVRAELLSPEQLRTHFPFLNVDDLGGAVFSPEDGWFDASQYLHGMIRKAQSLGVQYINGEVTALHGSDHALTELTLTSGERMAAQHFVNAAGPWAGRIAALAGMTLPVAPMQRFEYVFAADQSIPTMPYVKDMAGLAIRADGANFSGGLVSTNTPRGFCHDLDPAWFEQRVRPAVQARFPGLGSLRLLRSWSGLYEQSELDGNPFIGAWREGRANFYTAAGFSGHGLMHAPAAGLAIAELIVKGHYQTLDLTRFGCERILRNEPYRERGIL